MGKKIIVVAAVFCLWGAWDGLSPAGAAESKKEGPKAAKAQAAPDAALSPLAIHAGDKVNIQIYREKDMSGVFTVDGSGSLNYDVLGEIHVEGMTPEKLKIYLTEELGKNYLVNPQVTVDFEESANRSKSVSILGQIVKSGNYAFTPNLTLIRLVSEAGGFTPSAAINRVRIIRYSGDNKRITIHVNAGGILDGSAPDVPIAQGDVVVIPESFF